MPDFIGIDFVTVPGSGNRPVNIPANSIIGLIGTAPGADPDKFPLNTPVPVFSALGAVALDATADGSGGGSLIDSVKRIYKKYSPVVIIVRVEEGDNTAETMGNIVGNPVQVTGVNAFKKTDLALRPSILIATGWTHQHDGAANPVASALFAISEAIDGYTIIDGPSTSVNDAILAAGYYGSDFGFIVENMGIVDDGSGPVPVPASADVAALAASLNFWESAMNRPLDNFVDVSRPIEFSITDGSAEVHTLNRAGMGALVLFNGVRLWGDQTPGSKVSITKTAINNAVRKIIAEAHAWAIGRPRTAALAEEIVNRTASTFRRLVQAGAFRSFDVYLDNELNPAEGKLFVNLHYDDAEPLYQLVFSVFE